MWLKQIKYGIIEGIFFSQLEYIALLNYVELFIYFAIEWSLENPLKEVGMIT